MRLWRLGRDARTHLRGRDSIRRRRRRAFERNAKQRSRCLVRVVYSTFTSLRYILRAAGGGGRVSGIET
jgi:hypothetical protein